MRVGNMRFIDLFAGLGGFNLALSKLGHTCVFACEIDETLGNLYEKNFGIKPAGDIRHIKAPDIPSHDILCAGFPCQPFSKAGNQEGLADRELGRLYKDILRIIRYHKPRYLILENVPNLQNHNEGKTWEKIAGLIRKEGYDVKPPKKISPHNFGIPQIRERIYIVGSSHELDSFSWPQPTLIPPSIDTILDHRPSEAHLLSKQVTNCLKIWQEFLNLLPKDEKIPHPLWSMEFGATYPYKDTTPSALTVEELRHYRGSYGCLLNKANTKEELLKLLPSHARVIQDRFPDWKVHFIHRNREFYKKHQVRFAEWMPKIMEFPSSFQKLEWNCQEKDPKKEIRQLARYVIQIRPSGVRVKRPSTAPSLVAMTPTQVPIIAWERRYMTPTECKRLQSMESIQLPESDSKAYEALGNAVNVEVVKLVAEALVSTNSSYIPRSQAAISR
jgi:DNA (cytosine-5)-methyltransferase 1